MELKPFRLNVEMTYKVRQRRRRQRKEKIEGKQS